LTDDQRAALRRQEYTTTAAVLEASSAEAVAAASGITCGAAGRLRAAARTWTPRPEPCVEVTEEQRTGLGLIPAEVRGDAEALIQRGKMRIGSNGSIAFRGGSRERTRIMRALGYR
jgi:hypothetical protein